MKELNLRPVSRDRGESEDKRRLVFSILQRHQNGVTQNHSAASITNL